MGQWSRLASVSLILVLLSPKSVLAMTWKDRAVGIVADMAIDPASFLYDLHRNTEDFTPIAVGKMVEGGIDLFPAFLPMAMLNGNMKIRALKEHGGLPQIDLLGGGWSSMIMWFLPGKKISWHGWHAGALVTASIDPRMRVFGGYEYSRMSVVADMGDTLTKSSFFKGVDTKYLATLDYSPDEHFLVLGGEILRTADKYLTAQINYGLKNHKFSTKLCWKGSNFNTGISFYPEGSWVIWPFESYTVRF